MKTKLLLISLFSLVLLSACTTDDNNLEQETATLEATNRKSFTLEDLRGGIKIKEESSEPQITWTCVYKKYCIDYPSSAINGMSDYDYALLYRSILKNDSIGSSCYKYNFPETLSLKYSNGQFSEEIEKLFKYLEETKAPKGDEYDIEL